MIDNKAEGGTNARPLDESIAGTGPGIPDEARGPGEEIPTPPSDKEVERTARHLRADGEGPQDPDEETSSEPNLASGRAGSASNLQPGGTQPGGGPGASTGSIGTGGGSTAGKATGNAAKTSKGT